MSGVPRQGVGLPVLISALLANIALSVAAWGGVIPVAQSDTRVSNSGVVILLHPVIPDSGETGVIHVTGDNVDLDFRGATLRGSDHATFPDRYEGIGIRVTGRNVTLRNVSLSGFRVGILADGADGLRIINADLTDLRRQRLGSTLHYDDDDDRLVLLPRAPGEWHERYGAGVAVINTQNMDISDVRVRDGQNGIVLENVRRARLIDNDCSFLSGWGLAMWRCGEITVSRNRFDFCVRGYAHDFYAFGYGSAGVLMVDPVSACTLIENSVTHGGYGLIELRSSPDADSPISHSIIRNDFAFSVREPVLLHAHPDEENRTASERLGNPGTSAAAVSTSGDTANRLDHTDALPVHIADAAPGRRDVLGMRRDLGDREAIRMTRWGPWDHASIRLAPEGGLLSFDAFRVLGVDPASAPPMNHVTLLDGSVQIGRSTPPQLIRVSPAFPGVPPLLPYRISVVDGPHWTIESGALLPVQWRGTLFDAPYDPVTEYEQWRDDMHRTGVATTPRRIDFPIHRDPLTDHMRRFIAQLTDVPITTQRFGLVFESPAVIPAGRWRVTVIGNNGYRLRIDNEVVIDGWEHRDRTARTSYEFSLDEDTRLWLDLEYFQASGPALLRMEWENLEWEY